MGEVITYKNQPGGVFAQIKLDNGERILISLSTSSAMGLKIFKLFLGSMPIWNVYKSTLEEAVNLFLKPGDWGSKQGILLDKIVESLLDSKSTTDMKDKIEKLKKQTIR